MALNPQITVKSLPVARQPLELATLTGIKIYNRTFRRVESSMYLSQIVVRVRGRASRAFEAEISAANGCIEKELAQLQGLLAQRNRQLNKQLAQAGLDRTRHAVTYTQPVNLELTTRTPEAMAYATHVLSAESAARTLDILWYQGQLTAADHLAFGYEVFRWMQTVTGRIEQWSMELARRVTDELRTPRSSYQALLRHKLGVNLQSSAPLTADEFHMNSREAQSLALTETLAEVLEHPAPADDTSSPPLATENAEPSIPPAAPTTDSSSSVARGGLQRLFTPAVGGSRA